MKGNLDEIFSRIQSLEEYLSLSDTKTLGASLESLIKYTNQTKAYLKNLIYWSRLETNLISTHPSSVSIGKIVKEVVKEYEGAIQRKKINFKNSFENDDLHLFVDEYSFRIIIDNLLSNALKFTNYHEFIEINHTVENDRVNVSVINRGIFFTDALQQKVFNFEYHSDESMEDENRGSGLGLALTKELIEKNNGEFSIHANENLTEIKFSLPLHGKV
jgi:signal transduction histidine kinase